MNDEERARVEAIKETAHSITAQACEEIYGDWIEFSDLTWLLDLVERQEAQRIGVGGWWPEYCSKHNGWHLQNDDGGTDYLFNNHEDADTACRALNDLERGNLIPSGNGVASPDELHEDQVVRDSNHLG